MGSPHLPPPPLLEPAWYPDPTGRYEARYWDGRKWTSHISHYGATGADPLLRARWDRPWLRILGRLVLWGAIAGAGFWAYDTYWPEDNRDLEAEQSLIESGLLIAGDLPAGGAWSRGAAPLLSPLDLDVDDEGEVPLVACADFAGLAADAADEPRARVGFRAADGLRAVGNGAAIGKNTSLAEDYVDQLRSEDAGACLMVLWADSTAAPGSEIVVEQQIEPSFGDEAVWWRLQGTDTSGSFAIDVSLDLVVVRVDRAISEFVFRGAVNPVGVDVQRDVISVQVARTRELLAVLDATEDETDPAADGS